MVRGWLTVNLKQHGVDCGGAVGRIGMHAAGCWPQLGYGPHLVSVARSAWTKFPPDSLKLSSAVVR
jgi:hypothetical protein